MTCCGDKAKKVLGMARNIATGWYNLLLHKSHEDTKLYGSICLQCGNNRFLGIRGICGICKCFLPAKTRVPPKEVEVTQEDGTVVIVKEMVVDCPLGYWPPPGGGPAPNKPPWRLP